jgi:large subunit ribosomal protein L9
MKVILQRDIPKVGKGGEIVTVADGYARNYLFPRDFAVPAAGGALKEHKAREAREKERSAGLLAGAQKDAGKLEGLTLTILAKVGSGTKLYGSITAQDIADEVQKQTGVKVDKRRVGLADPIKTLGSYTIPVRLHSDVSVQVPVLVTTPEELERRKAQEAAAAAAAAAAPAETPAEEDTGDSADGAAEESAGASYPDTVEPVASEVTEGNSGSDETDETDTTE